MPTTNVSQCDRVRETFEPWLGWSRDLELFALLALVQRALVARGWQVAIEVSHAREGPLPHRQL